MKNLFALLLLLLFLSLASCNGFEQVVDIEIPEHQAALSIYALFDNIDSTLEIRFGRSASILEPLDSLLLEETVSISLYRNDQLLTNQFDCQAGHCLSSINPPLGAATDEYRLEVSAPGWETLVAVQQMPSTPVVENLDFSIGGALDDEGVPVNALNITLQDPAQEENYYAVEVFLFYPEYIYDNNGQIVDSILHSYPSFAGSLDPTFSTVYTGQKSLIIGKDAAFDGGKYVLRLYTYESLMPGQQALVLISAITRDAYLFYQSYNAYQNSLYDPFAEPVIVHQNVENGHGVFLLKNSLEKLVIF